MLNMILELLFVSFVLGVLITAVVLGAVVAVDATIRTKRAHAAANGERTHLIGRPVGALRPQPAHSGSGHSRAA